MKKKYLYDFSKRFFDIAVSIIGIIVLIVPFCIISIIIIIETKGPVFFIQDRVGKNKKNFKIIKFRTMKIGTNPNLPTNELINPSFFITKVGSFLRKTSLDELPQLYNILLGQMSFVGPRPALWNQYDLIEKRDLYNANNIKPGLTGLAQINGRDELNSEKKARFDGEYVIKRSVFLDLKILMYTLFKVVNREGIIEGKRS